MEMEDDLFFADLSKQISLLIMDEEDDHDDIAPPPWHSYHLPDLYHVPRQQHLHQQQQQQPPRLVPEQEKNHHGTGEIISKGTGVFIPRFAQPRRKRGMNHHHSTRHGSSFSDNYTRPNHHCRQQQQQQHDYGTRRLHQEDSKANYFHSRFRILLPNNHGISSRPAKPRAGWLRCQYW